MMTVISSPNHQFPLRTVMAAFLFAVGFVALKPAAVAADPMSAISLVAHRAIYDLKLDKSSDKSGISSATGRLVFELEGDNCVGYTVNMRVVTLFRTAAGQSTIDTRSTSWEAADGNTMRFGTKQYVNATLADDVEGKAQKGADGSNGAATFAKPNKGSFELPARAVFPVEHTKRIVTAALTGNVMERTLVFDGSELNKLYTAVSFIGKAKKTEEITLPESVTDKTIFERQTAWPVTVSYFDQNTAEAGGEQVPSHEVSFTMFENGISTDLTLGYEHFSLAGSMSELTLFEAAECDQ